MRLLRLLIPAALVASAAPAGAESQAVIVSRNDGFISGPVTFRPGFQAGDTIAARLDTGVGPAAVIAVHVLFGGVSMAGQLPVTLKIWDDTAETLEPGPELLSMEASLIVSDSVKLISLAGVGVPDQFRVGIVLGQDAPPMIAHDVDGTIAADLNFTRRAGAAWQTSQADGATGDWILRAVVAPSGGGGGGGGGTGTCFGVDCPAGQFCDLESQGCTFECVTEDDCGGAFCNRFGQCVGESAGCCQAGGGGGAVPVGLGLGVLAVLLLRRRRR